VVKLSLKTTNKAALLAVSLKMIVNKILCFAYLHAETHLISSLYYRQIPLLRPDLRPGFAQKKVADLVSEFFLVKTRSE